MSAIDRLVTVSTRRTEDALIAWQQLRAQFDEAMRKLSLLKQHRQRYHDLMHAGLAAGMPATATIVYLEFIGQIDEVVLRQEGDLGGLQEVCARQWQQLVEARREQRRFEILGEHIAARTAEAALRRQQAELDELLQRAALI
jgi:flagellar export protein FliJ